jgi:membrane-associated protein
MTAFVQAAGYPLLGLLVLLGTLGMPIPLGVALSAAGALARQGHMSLPGLYALCTLAAVAGDCLGYAMGRFGVARALHYLPESWQMRLAAAFAVLQQRTQRMRTSRIAPSMGMVIFLTRWALTAPGSMVNVIAGARRYPWEDFLRWDLFGEALWVAIALIPGYLVGNNGGSGLLVAIAAGLLIAVLTPLIAGRFTSRLHTGQQPSSTHHLS